MMNWVSQHLIDIAHYNGGFTINASYLAVGFAGFLVFWRVKKAFKRA